MNALKKVLFIALCLAMFNVASSQGTLQFNRAVLLNSASTVPEGKVWKVESVAYGINNSFQLNTGISDCLMSIMLNGNHVCVSYFHFYLTVMGTSNSSESAFNPTNFPIWLPAGTTIDLGKNAVFISILEFIAP